MSKYIISNGSFRKVPDDELMHWKYIKREKVNGKWVYTYNKPKNDAPTNEKTAKKGGSQFKISNFFNAGKAKLQQISEKSEQRRAEKKRDWEESKVRGTEKAIKEATKYDGGIVIKNDKHGARTIKATFKDSDKWLNSSTTIDTGDTEITEFRRGKIDRFIDTAKEYIKDRLGYDERDALNAAKDIKEVSEAATAYFNTPLGKIEKARDAGEAWLEKLFGKRR